MPKTGQDNTWEPDMGIMAYADMPTRTYLKDPASALAPYMKSKTEYFYSEKKDGWHCIWDGEGKLYSKSGKLTFDAPPEVIDDFRAVFGNNAVSGELMIEGEQAPQVRALLKREGPWERYRFYAFDLPGKISRELPFTDRMKSLYEIFMAYKRKLRPVKQSHRVQTHIDMLTQYLLNEKDSGDHPYKVFGDPVKVFHKRWSDIVNEGGEGVVITAADSIYTKGRVGKMVRIKLKQRADDEAEVIGYNEKSLAVRNIDSGVEFTLGIGFTKAQRSNLKSVFPIGTIVKYSYRSLHTSGKPKEARIVGIRDAADMTPKPSTPTKSVGSTTLLLKRAKDFKSLNFAEFRELELLMDSLYEGQPVDLKELGINLDRITVGDARNITRGLLMDPVVLKTYDFAPLITSKGSDLYPERLSENTAIEDIIENGRGSPDWSVGEFGDGDQAYLPRPLLISLREMKKKREVSAKPAKRKSTPAKPEYSVVCTGGFCRRVPTKELKKAPKKASGKAPGCKMSASNRCMVDKTGHTIPECTYNSSTKRCGKTKRKSSAKPASAKPAKRKSTAKPAKRKSTAKPAKRKSTAKPAKRKSTAKPAKRKSTAKPDKRKCDEKGYHLKGAYRPSASCMFSMGLMKENDTIVMPDGKTKCLKLNNRGVAMFGSCPK